MFFREKKPASLDAPETTIHHRNIVLRKSFLRKLYIEWYKRFLVHRKDLPEGKIIEIGSGGGFLKTLAPDIITSDILQLPHCDLVFPAEKMPFDNESVSAIFMMDVFHHLSEAELFLKEAERILAPGGMIFMIEPANTWFSRLIFKNLHHEPFNEYANEWKFPSSGPLSGANIALPWIVFCRDRELFETSFPCFKVTVISLHTPFRYIVTGGLSFKSMVPGWSFVFVRFIEKLFSPLFSKIAMFQDIIIRKKITKT